MKLKMSRLGSSRARDIRIYMVAGLLVVGGGAVSSDEFGHKVVAPNGGSVTRIGPTIRPFGYGDMDAIWPHTPGQGTNISVCWESLDDSTEELRILVSSKISDTWSDAAAVKFIGWKKCVVEAGGVHIQVGDSGPRALKLGKNLDKLEHGLLLNFTFKDWVPDPWCNQSKNNRLECIRAIAVHEFGHVLGLSHEQNREDTPGECQELPQGPDGTKELTPWDKSSVMNYCNRIYKADGWKLSDGDKSSVAAMYGVRF